MANPLERRAPRPPRGRTGGALSSAGIVLVTLVGFSLFFFSFLTAPLIVIGILCLALAVSSRPRRTAESRPPVGREATLLSEDDARRETIEVEATVRGADGRPHPIAEALNRRRRT